MLARRRGRVSRIGRVYGAVYVYKENGEGGGERSFFCAEMREKTVGDPHLHGAAAKDSPTPPSSYAVKKKV